MSVPAWLPVVVVAWLAFNVLVVLWCGFDAYMNARRLRRSRARLEALAVQHDERAARAVLRPYTGNVEPFPIHPPTNGKP